MSEQTMLYNSVAPLRNVAALMGQIERVQSRAIGLPGMAVFYGPSGFGKTSAVTYCRNRYQAFAVEMRSAWTKKALCEAILLEMGLRPENTVAKMVSQIAEHLAITDRPLIIDEADVAVKRNMVEIIRDIYEGSQGCVLLVGEETLPQMLQRWERVHGRIYSWVAAEPGCLDDVSHLARIYAPGLELSDDLKAQLLEGSRLSIRRISNNLAAVAELAQVKGLSRVDVKDWGKRPWIGGEPPKPRVFAAPGGAA